MTVFNIKPKAFYDRMQDAVPSQPYNYSYGDRPTFTFHFLPDTIVEGDLLVFAVDNDMLFYDAAPENILHSATCMVVCKHEVTGEEAIACSVDMQIETRTVKFRDVVNGKVRPLDVVSGLYLKHGSGQDTNYTLLAKARAFANGIIADYDSLPEPITIDDYYTKDEIDSKLAEKADEDALTAHTSDTDIHVTLQDKSTWDSKADIQDIPVNVSQLNNDSDYQNAQQVSASISTAIADKADKSEIPTNVSELTNDAGYQTQAEVSATVSAAIADKADRSEIPTNVSELANDSDYQNAQQVSATVSAAVAPKADSSSVYTKTETDVLLGSKADVATTLSGYGITDAYTKSEVDNKIASVYRYCGTVSTYADLPASGQEIGDVYNVETADAQHGIKDGDNVAWNGTTWDVLAGTVDLSGYLEKPATAGTTGQVLTVTADGSAWQDVPTEIPAGGSVGQVLTMTSSGLDWDDVPDELPASTTQDDGKVLTVNASGEPEWKEPAPTVPDGTDYLRFTAKSSNTSIKLNPSGTPSAAPVNLEYSTDKLNWTTYTWADSNPYEGTSILLSNVGDSVWFRGDNNTISNGSVYYKFTINSEIYVSGNIMSMLSKNCSKTVIPAWCFKYIFQGSRILTSPDMPVVQVEGHSCEHMFENCTSLKMPPKLPATIISNDCYNSMFKGCTALLETPELPATTLKSNCYDSMFMGCTSLRNAYALPATSLVAKAYNYMFRLCSSLTVAPEIYATSAIWTDACYCMFYDCANLEIVPLLNASSINYSAYGYMFKNCTKLKYIHTNQTTFNGCGSWLDSVSAVGVFDCKSTLDTSTRGVSTVPEGWIVTHGANEPDTSTTATIEAVSTDTYTVCPSGQNTGVVTVSSTLTLNAYPTSANEIAYAEVVLDIAEDAVVTAGTNVTFYDAPVAGKRNVYEVRWQDTIAILRIKYLEDLPQA